MYNNNNNNNNNNNSNDELAEIVNKLMSTAVCDESINELQEKTVQPENAKYLLVPRLPLSIWRSVDTSVRKADLKVQTVQKSLNTAIISVTDIMDSIIKSIQQEDKSQSQRSNFQSLLERLSDGLSLLTATNELNKAEKKFGSHRCLEHIRLFVHPLVRSQNFCLGEMIFLRPSKIETATNKIRNRPSANRNRPSAKSSQSHRQIFKPYAYSSRSFGGTNMFKSSRNQGRYFFSFAKEPECKSSRTLLQKVKQDLQQWHNQPVLPETKIQCSEQTRPESNPVEQQRKSLDRVSRVTDQKCIDDGPLCKSAGNIKHSVENW